MKAISTNESRGKSMAALELVAEKPPLTKDGDGVFRVGGTRVRLETIINAFESGSLPEEILYKYPSLNLTDIYAVITYYLQHREDINAYLMERRRLQDETEQDIEERFPSGGIRERLLARRKANA
jgi:uncharacterized protein (DUF433 family)